MTISPDVLGRIDSMIDGNNVRSRSEAIESIMSQYLETNKTAVFLGGGDVDRLIIDGQLKPLIEIRGKSLIEHNIGNLKKSGFRNIHIIGKSELIGECFKLLGNGAKNGVKIDYTEEGKTMGNAKTLQLAESSLKSSFLVLPVDNFFDFDLDYLARSHVNGRNVTTLAVQSNRGSKMNLGMVEMIGNQIIGYEERPKNPKTFLTAAFIGMYDPCIFEYIPKGNTKWVLQTDVFPKLVSENKLYGCIVPGFYMNVDNMKDVRATKNFLRRNK